MNARDALEVDLDTMRDVYMTKAQREAYERICAQTLVERAGEPVAWISATQLRRLAESRAADPSNLTNVGWAEAYATDNIPGMFAVYALPPTAPGASHE